MTENGMTKPHWKKLSDEYGDTYECSECGLMWCLDDGTPQENEMYYCPKCGSKMADFIESTDIELIRS